jgi:hypothetical protein
MEEQTPVQEVQVALPPPRRVTQRGFGLFLPPPAARLEMK